MRYALNVRMEITVDPSAWQAEYGTDGGADDVENYLLAQITQCPAAEAKCFTLTGYAVEAEEEPDWIEAGDRFRGEHGTGEGF